MDELTIIGGGPAGYHAALHAARRGAKVTLIEKEKVGGTCLHKGCIPTKALLHGAAAFKGLKKLEDYGISVENPRIDFLKLQRKKENVVNLVFSGLKSLVQSFPVEMVTGAARLTKNKTVIVKGREEDKEIQAKNILISTGSVPANLPFLTAAGKNILNSDHALLLDEIPESLLIVGGGVVGVEFACFFSMLGAEVTVLEQFGTLLPEEDEDMGQQIAKVFRRNGMNIYTGTSLAEVSTKDGRLCARVKGEQKKDITADKVLLAVGRKPNVDGLGLEDAGVKVLSGKIVVDETMQTTVSGIYAAGDCVGGIQLAHCAMQEGIVAAQNALGEKTTMDYSSVPRCIYSEPEVACVGLTEKEARKKGYDVSVSHFPFSANPKAGLASARGGEVKIVLDKKTNVILGAHMLGPSVTELIHMACLAVKHKIKGERLTREMFGHPTLSESFFAGVSEALGAGLDLPMMQTKGMKE